MKEVSGKDEFPKWASSFLGMQNQQPQGFAPQAQVQGQMQGPGLGNIQQTLANFLGMGQPQPQGISNYQQVLNPGQGPGHVGGVDIPPADMNDPFGGNRAEMIRAGLIDPDQMNNAPNLASWFDTSRWGGFGNSPSFGSPAFGPTQLPTNWTNYPGVGYVPMALPAADNPSSIWLSNIKQT